MRSARTRTRRGALGQPGAGLAAGRFQVLPAPAIVRTARDPRVVLDPADPALAGVSTDGVRGCPRRTAKAPAGTDVGKRNESALAIAATATGDVPGHVGGPASVARVLNEDELIEHWTLIGDELDLLTGRTRAVEAGPGAVAEVLQPGRSSAPGRPATAPPEARRSPVRLGQPLRRGSPCERSIRPRQC